MTPRATREAAVSSGVALELELPLGFGVAYIGARIGDHPRAYDARGRTLTWITGPGVPAGAQSACDIEVEPSSRPSYLAARFGCAEELFRRRWVVTETIAKLLDVPILAYLDAHGLEEALPMRTRVPLVREKKALRLLVLDAESGRSSVAFGYVQ